MKTKTLYKAMSTVALGAALTFGATFQAQALPQFTVDPSGLGGDTGTLSPFVADHIDGGASTLVKLSGPSTITGMGYLTFSGYTLNTAPVFNTGLGQTWGQYATFNYSATLTSGTLGGDTATYNIDFLTFDLFAYNAKAGTTLPVYTKAEVLASGPTGGTVTQGSSDVKVGSGSLIPGKGTISSNDQNGTTVTTTNSYANTPFGNTFFVNPSPFYDIAFESITNNTSGLQRNAAHPEWLAINAASNSADFANAVPEPGSLALIGAGLIGFAATRRRKSA